VKPSTSSGRSTLALAALSLLLVSVPRADRVGARSDPAHAPLGPVPGGALPGPLPLLPPTNWWNLDISGAPVDPQSSAFIGFINNGGAAAAPRLRRHRLAGQRRH